MSTITKAIQDLEEQKKRIESALKILRDLDHSTSRSSASTSVRNISAEGRKRIAEAQKRRWAKVRAARGGTSSSGTAKK
jgi:hypothetical protein